MTVVFEPTRAAALARLNAFMPQAGRDYAARRNYDLPGHEGVSRLSPYLRYRMISEDEVLSATLRQHSPSSAEKFIQEVCWRTYWKGVLERRPALWADYKIQVQAGLNRVQTEAGLRAEWEAACKGDTGIDCFDHWAQELVTTGYLHNHARMWFASIWIFTLRLPWALGADFFLRHLLDGCPASNTLSWRWVGGLQTKGKTYLARPDNIAKYTNGRFKPTGLAPFAAPLDGPDLPTLGPVPNSGVINTAVPIGLLITEDDLSLPLPSGLQPKASAILAANDTRSPLATSRTVTSFVTNALQDAQNRFEPDLGALPVLNTEDDVCRWAESNGLSQIVLPFAPAGFSADRMQGIRPGLQSKNIALCQIIRSHDQRAWPSATHGFFRFKSVIPKLIADDRQMKLI